MNSRPLVRYNISNAELLTNYLSPIELEVIHMRLGIGKYDRTHRFTEIANILGYNNSQRIKQIEIRSLLKIKHNAKECKIITRFTAKEYIHKFMIPKGLL